MQSTGDHFLFSPSDLTNFVACEHLTQLEAAVALEETTRPSFENAYSELIKRKGKEHELRFLDTLKANGHVVSRVGLADADDFQTAAKATVDAMCAGIEYVHQAVFLSDRWHGIADFLERVERPSALGPWSYVVLDTKLARHPRPEHALQLCFYTQCLGEIQKLEPEVAYVVLGTTERIPIKLGDVLAYYRRLRRRFELAAAGRMHTVPYPCEHCRICDFQSVCVDQWEREDHLVRVAGIRRDQVDRLMSASISTLTELAKSHSGARISKMSATTFETLHEQAALQLERRRSGRIEYQMFPIGNGRGLAALPQRSRGDIVFDLEGHPFFEPARGLEFLFGIFTFNDSQPKYYAFWAHNRNGERKALEAFIDLLQARLALHPDLHVYHFGVYEPTAIKRLMGEYGTRESQVDDLLRRKIFINLHTVVRQALRAGVPSYSLKDLEPLFIFTRSTTVRSGLEAILQYENWITTRDDELLAKIAAYNEDDCRATLALLDWLHGLRPSDLGWPAPPPSQTVSEEATEAFEARQRLRQELLEGAAPGTSRWLTAELLEYHRREARPAWWWYYERLGMTPEELVDDSESIGCLESDPSVPPEPRKRSFVHTLRFRPQDHKLGPGPVDDPAAGNSAGELIDIDDATGTLRLMRGPKLAGVALPTALIPRGPYDDRQQRDAILRFAESIRSGTGRYPALQAILDRERPHVRGLTPRSRLQTNDLVQMKDLALRLDRSYLFVQGPPGTGKTWTGARLVVHLLAHGKRVGVTSQSHKAIHNILDEIETVAREIGLGFRGLKKSTAGNPESEYEGDFIKSESEVSRVVRANVQLLAGTAWLFARTELDGELDCLVIDEAGQVSLADSIAMGTSARKLILLGDPLQLAQVSQGSHPSGTGASVLEHLLGGAPTIQEDRGVFLERSFRMHPDVCAFVSEIVYAGRLQSDASAARRTTSLGTGMRFIAVEHQGNRSASDEEVEQIAVEIRDMLPASFTEADGTSRQLREDDFVVVTPYNAQVRRLRARLPAGVRVGTVDKLQGQEAPIVFFSMATSSGEDVPRNLAFLFSRNRMNVAISRAQCLALLVCSPRLLEARCNSIEEMELVNALCRLVEYAEGRFKG
jgi:predicted RecB family nuclease